MLENIALRPAFEDEFLDTSSGTPHADTQFKTGRISGHHAYNHQPGAQFYPVLHDVAKLAPVTHETSAEEAEQLRLAV
jgi:hypothetical protein